MKLSLFYTFFPSLIWAAHLSQSVIQAPGTVKNLTIWVGSTERSFLLFLPPSYESSSSPSPLILSYHGGGRDAQRQLRLDQFTNPFFNTDAVVVYPEGIDGKWQGVPKWRVDDIQFTNTLLDHLVQRYRIDQNRIWATGKSQGGGFVGLLACDRKTSTRIAAFAPVSGAFYTTVSEDSDCDPNTVNISCNPGRLPIPFIEFHGGKDDTIDYDGGTRRGVCLPSIPHYLESWAMRNGLGQNSQNSKFTEHIFIRSYGNGLVKAYYDENMGHDWPSTVKNADNSRDGHSPASFNATSIILDFFHQYSLK